MINDDELEKLYLKLENEYIELEYSENILHWYISSIMMPILSKEEEKILLYQISKGDKRARKIFIERNLRLVKEIAFRYKYNGLPIIDLISEGNIALINAIDRYDIKQGKEFSTYAYAYIEGKIKRAIHEKSRIINIPVKKFIELDKLKKIQNSLTIELGREPDDNELADYLNTTVEKIKKIKYLKNDAVIISELSNKEDENYDENRISNIYPTQSFEEKVINEQSNTIILSEIINNTNLNENEKIVLKLKYGFTEIGECKQQEIAKKLGMSRQNISYIIKGAMQKLNKSAIRLSYTTKKIKKR